eukprot:1159865-Pelagomonas_calceolata.AAC.4
MKGKTDTGKKTWAAVCPQREEKTPLGSPISDFLKVHCGEAWLMPVIDAPAIVREGLHIAGN